MANSLKKTEAQKQDYAAFQDAIILNKLDAVKKYGKPHFHEQLILESKQRGLRTPLNNRYTQEELLSKSILIEELTWEKDTKTWITVWYQITNKKIEPKDFCIWKKGTDFYSFNS